MTSDLTVAAMTESLTGFDELCITRLFGADVADLPGTMTLRALVCIAERRGGQALSDADAYTASMEMSLHDVMAYFPKGDDDDDDRDPMVEDGANPRGKGAAATS